MFVDLREEISQDGVARDLRVLLDKADWHVEIDGESVDIDRSGSLDIVARSCHAYEYDIGFGDHYRVLVAVGGVQAVEHGVVQPRVCFASTYTNGTSEFFEVTNFDLSKSRLR